MAKFKIHKTKDYTTMSNSHFENKNELRETAKRILEKKGTSSEATQKILEKSVFDIPKNKTNN